jgi:hypothetical protein
MSKHRDDSDAVFLALTHHRLGNADKAREYLERLRKSARQDKQDLVAEVEALLDPSGP